MSFASTIVLKDAAAASENFLRINADSQKVNYALASASLSTPVTLTIGHQMTSARDGSDRHLVKVSRTVLDSNFVARTAVLNCTLSVPRLGISRVNIDNSVAELIEFFKTTANVDALLRGEL